MLEYTGARLWRRINNVAVMLFIAIDNQSDVKGFKMEIAEVEEAAAAVCHGDRRRRDKRTDANGTDKKPFCPDRYDLCSNQYLIFCKEECDYTVDWMI